MSIQKTAFGKTSDGQAVDLYTLTNVHGLVAKITNFGGRVTELHVPDRNGWMGNVVLGYATLEPYLKKNPYFGSIAGRVANRIALGRFTIDGHEYHVPKNNGPNSLHGGLVGFDSRVWKAEEVGTPNSGKALKLTYFSKDGEEGYPGNLTATVIYTLTDANELRVEFGATTDKATPVNLCNHSYFNLKGPGKGDVLDHKMMIRAGHYTPVDATLIPTGEIKSVKGTPMDFTQPHKIGERIKQVDGGGYDHNYVLDPPAKATTQPVLAARVEEESTGRVMEVETTQPGVQFYSGNFLDGSDEGIGGKYFKHGGFCLETQHFPDSVNQPKFPNTVLRPGEEYWHTAVYRFATAG